MARPITDETGNVYNGWLAIQRTPSAEGTKTPRYLWRCTTCGHTSEKYLSVVKPVLKTRCPSCGWGAERLEKLYVFVTSSLVQAAKGSTAIQAAVKLENFKFFADSNAIAAVMTRTGAKQTWAPEFVDWEAASLAYQASRRKDNPFDAAPITLAVPPRGVTLTLRVADIPWLTKARQLADGYMGECPLYIVQFVRSNRSKGVSWPNYKITYADDDRTVAFATWQSPLGLADLSKV